MWSSMRKINEIFYSIQGEGYFVGTPTVFLRFSGCNLRCPFCDTSHEDGEMMDDDEIVRRVSSFPSRRIVLTGGEPSLWIDAPFIARLKAAGFFISIETNGTRPLPPGIDWVTCSPKEGARVVLTAMDEVKVVFIGQDVERYHYATAAHHFLQPCSGQNTAETLDYIMRHPHWRLSLQLHKLIGVR